MDEETFKIGDKALWFGELVEIEGEIENGMVAIRPERLKKFPALKQIAFINDLTRVE